MTTSRTHRAARFLTDGLNPFFLFTALVAAAAFTLTSPGRAFACLLAEGLSAGLVAGFVLLMRRRSRVSGFWMVERAERLVPAVVLLAAFAGLLAALYTLAAPDDLFGLTLSMGLAAATVATTTFFWKASAHCAVAGHAAVAGPLLLGPAGLVFTLALPLVAWSRVRLGAHTVGQVVAGAAVGAAFSGLFLV